MIPIDADEGVRVNVVQSGGVIKPTAPIYWAAPEVCADVFVRRF